MNDIASCVDAVIRSRRTTRAFRDEPLSVQQVREILDVASSAPSNSNTQPWKVHVLTGAPMREFGESLAAAFRDDTLPPSGHFPDALPEAAARRQQDFALRYYGALGIDRQDAVARSRQTQRNFSFFGAPIGLIFSIDRTLRPHSWLDLGLFVQNVMIVAKARGIDTCPQVSFARFHPLIARFLDMPDSDVTACGMSMGYGDPEAQVNRMQMPRDCVDDFARFAGFGT